MHGKTIEDFIKSLFPGSSDCGRSCQSDFDIEAKFDKILHIPTDIKTTGSGDICLADARKFFQRNESFRWLIAPYTQNDEQKIFSEIFEYIVDRDILNKIRGNLCTDVVCDFHNKLKDFSSYNDARVFAKERKKELIGFCGIVKLNPKIDSKSQRRLQCSIAINDLDKFVDCKRYEKDYKGLVLPIFIKSSKREFKGK